VKDLEAPLVEEPLPLAEPQYPYVIKTEMTFQEMVDAHTVWDQTIGCDNCGKAWWAEDATPDVTMFHRAGCPAKGRRDVAVEVWNVDLIERELGRRIGYPES
jgi:hypothetical protein